MKYDFDQIVQRRGTDSAKWGRYPADVLPLWVADMDFASPPPIGRAIIERVQHNVFGYGLEPMSFREVLCERMQRLYQWQIEPAHIVFLPGLVCGLSVISRALGQAGDNVLVNTPVYPPCHSMPVAQGRSIKMVEMAPTLPGGHIHYAPDFADLQAAIQPNTAFFMFCNPHNPIGRAYNRNELEQFAELCLRNNLPVCSDEIHCDLLLGGTKHIPLASISPEIAERTITLMAPSKTFNVPGLGCSFAIIQNEELRKQINQAAMGIVPHPNILGMVAGEAAFADPECAVWLDQLRAYLTANRDFMVDYVDRHLPGIKCTVPEATYLGWLDCREAGIEGNAYNFFLEEAKVALNPGPYFGQGGEGFVRINFGCTRATLEQGLEQMRVALASR